MHPEQVDLGEDDHFNLVKHGNLHLTLKFSEPLPETVIVIAHPVLDIVIKVNRDRNIVLDVGV